MEAMIEYLKSHTVKDQYGYIVNVIEVRENTVYTTIGMYHTTKLFVNSQSVYNLIKEYVG